MRSVHSMQKVFLRGKHIYYIRAPFLVSLDAETTGGIFGREMDRAGSVITHSCRFKGGVVSTSCAITCRYSGHSMAYAVTSTLGTSFLRPPADSWWSWHAWCSWRWRRSWCGRDILLATRLTPGMQLLERGAVPLGA